MKMVYAFEAYCFDYTEILCNILVTRGARIINVQQLKPDRSDVDGGIPYKIWFEHELATDREWQKSICHLAELTINERIADHGSTARSTS